MVIYFMKRLLLKPLGLLIMIPCMSACMALPSFASIAKNQKPLIGEKLASLERATGGRLGVYAINTTDNRIIEYHANKRFPLCSTIKAIGVAAILKKSETNIGLLQEKIKYQKFDLVAWSPMTKKYANSGMTISALSKAAITLSDSTAINLLIKRLGGPKAVNAFARSIGDNTFRLDRLEPELNTAIPGDLRDTSTPEAMGNSIRKLVLGNALAPEQRKLLKTWLVGNATGDTRIRAGVPKGWIVGDKTGTCAYGTTNDIGVIWPPNSAPIVIAIYFTQNKEAASPRDDIIASATLLVL